MTQAPSTDPILAARAPGGAPSAWFATLALLAATAVLLRASGRIWWCKCGGLSPLTLDVWTPHCSQHLIDAYTLSHFLHGVVFFAAFTLLRPRWSIGWRFTGSIALASFWEVLENSPLIIGRYRESTMSLDYLGDSVINSMADIGACALGFVVARRVGLWWSCLIFIAVELLMLAWIKDNLTLNVLMLVYPVPGIREWQAAGHAAG